MQEKSAAAQTRFGGSWRLRTEFWLSPPAAERAHRRLVLRGAGDPTLSFADLQAAARAVVAAEGPAASAPIDVAVRTYVRAMLKAHAVDPALHQALMSQVLANGLEHFRELDAAAHLLVRSYLEQHKEHIVVKDLDLAAFVLVTSVEAITHVAAGERPELLASGALEDEVSAFVLRYLGVAVTGSRKC